MGDEVGEVTVVDSVVFVEISRHDLIGLAPRLQQEPSVIGIDNTIEIKVSPTIPWRLAIDFKDRSNEFVRLIFGDQSSASDGASS